MLPFSNPKVSESINRLTYRWPDMDIRIIADRLTEAGTAELWFYHSNGTGEKLLHVTKANLLATGTMNQIAKRMGEHSADIPWREVLTKIAAQTLDFQRYGKPGITLKPVSAENSEPVYLIKPLLMKGVPNVIYGDKGVNKTTIALTALGLIYCGCGGTDSPSGLSANESAKVGILDWESNEELTLYTLARLVEAGTIPYCEPNYLSCKLRLTDDIQRIATWITEKQIQVVVIDSLGAAAGSDKFDSAGKGAALAFFEALRQLNVTSLIIAQNSKSEEGKKTIFGSTYYTYYSRNVFELRKGKDTLNEDELHIALVHTEGNYSKKYSPIGFKVTYTSTSILIEGEETSWAQLKDRIEDTEAICEFLRQIRRLANIAEISKAIDKNEERTRVVLSLLKKRGKTVNPERGLWGLTAND